MPDTQKLAAEAMSEVTCLFYRPSASLKQTVSTIIKAALDKAVAEALHEVLKIAGEYDDNDDLTWQQKRAIGYLEADIAGLWTEAMGDE